MRTQHTPGPWFAEKENSYTGNVATCHWNGEEWWSVFSLNWSEAGSTEANARLIAAAPELLEALRPFAEIDLANSRLSEDFGMQVLSARAAIAKATGSSEG